MGQRVRMNLRAFILRLREDWIYCLGNHIIVLDSLIFQSCHFCSRFFWMAILKSERFFSSVNRWSGKDFGSSIGVLHEALKIAHTYTSFWRKFLWIRDGFLHYGFWDFLHILCAYYAERKFCHKYTHALSPVWNRPPIYTRIICEKNFAPDIYENCGAFRICGAIDWALVSLRLFISCFVCAVIVWIRSFLLIGRCQNLIVKAW